ncbi:MAG: site-2 protease family protein [Ancrocorticia sp.]
MKSIPGIVFLIVGILASVGLHEIGHLVPAKRFGTKVSQYFIGFGPTLWSKVVDGTEYGLKAIPLGGFVRIAGMVAPGEPERVQVNRRGQLTVAEETRRASAKELEPGEEGQAFWRLSPGKRLIVMAGGPFMNLLVAAVLLTVVYSGIGVTTASTRIATVTRCVSNAEVCGQDDPQAPAFDAGLVPGDIIRTWGGHTMTSWNDIQQTIAVSGTSPTLVEVERDGAPMNLTITPVLTPRPVIGEDGNVVMNDDGQPVLEERPYVGIGPAYDLVRRPITEVPGQLWQASVGTAQIIMKLPANLWSTASSLVTGEERSTDGVVGIVGVADLAGNITGSEVPEYGVMARTGDLLLLIASLNISLFVFNLIPLLPLDGGHIVAALYEWGKKKAAALTGRPDPGPVDTARLMPLSYAVALAFIAMTVLLVVADIFNPVF